MGREIEGKVRVRDVGEFRKALRHAGARTVVPGSGRVHEFNTLYDTETQDLRWKGKLLRVRVETPADRPRSKSKKRFVLTFKGPVPSERAPAPESDAAGKRADGYGGNHKIREEIELEGGDPRSLGMIFAGLGMRESFHYEKYRTTFRMPEAARWAKGLLVELDETPIGIFAELEGPAKAIDRAAKLLGYSKDDYVLTSYLGLHAEECKRRGEKV